MKGTITALSKSSTHSMVKQNVNSINLLKGLGVDGDVHMGKTVKHLSRIKRDSTQPNLRQVHLIHSELHEDLKKLGFEVKAGEMGENITTKGIDLLSLPVNTILQIGNAKLTVTGLRNPCHQLDGIQKGLMKATLAKDETGKVTSKVGVMSIVTEGGTIKVGDEIKIILPYKPHAVLKFV